MALTPVAFALSPSVLNMPVDVALGLAIPLHAHIGMGYVITDYVPKVSKGLVGPARILLLGITGVTVLGEAGGAKRQQNQKQYTAFMFEHN